MEVGALKPILEALLFVADKPLTLEQLREITGEETRLIKQCFEELQETYEVPERGFRLRPIAGGYQLVTDPELSEYMQRFALQREKRKLSTASLETLAIIAYRQSITRQEIEYIRGVNVDGAMKTLVDRGLVKIAGRKEVPGRPLLYATTKHFLDHFGLGALKDLPKLAEFKESDIELPVSLQQPAEKTPEEEPVPGPTPQENRLKEALAQAEEESDTENDTEDTA